MTFKQSEGYNVDQQVRQFHEAMGQPIGVMPDVPADERVRFRLRLIAEEFFEALEACGIGSATAEKLIDERIAEDDLVVDLPAFVDALGDIDYVVAGTRVEFGVVGAPIADEIHKSNMGKIGGPVRADGKRGRPPGWTPPDIAGELRKQGWEG